ncbi:MAG: hypothetical protein C0459_00775 [Chitinophaga sp.]|jgi:hypothetical protein|nr:hypothetical protein [Chitinophaga sp.]
MKQFVVVFITLLTFIACSKKTKPVKAVNKNNTIHNNTADSKAPNTATNTTNDIVATNNTTTAPMPTPMVVVDGSGRIITPKSKLPDSIAAKTDYSKLNRSFTPNEKTNLMYRFKLIPPKVLYVPDVYVKKSLKGEYCVYKQKFWYWKKADGLFYLDETYYK